MQRIRTTSSNMRCLIRLQPFLCSNITCKLFPFPHSNPTRLTQYSCYYIKRLHLKPKKSLQTHAKKKPKESEANDAIRSLFGEITEIIGEDSSFSGGNSSRELLSGDSEQSMESTPSVCENAEESVGVLPEEKKDVSPLVHRVAQIVRGESDSGSMEDWLEKSGIEFYDPEIVEKVLKRCFKEPDSAVRFFEFVKRRDGFIGTTEIYNTMLYIAGEARDFDLVEKLVEEMERRSCEKDVKTWTILVSHYGDAKMIGKALASYDKMIKSGIEPDGAVYKSLIRSLCEVGEGDIAMEFYKEMVKLEENPGLGLKLYRKLIGCVARSGDAMAVRSIADDMIRVSEIPIEVVYGVVLKSFCVSGRIREALEFIRDPRNDDVAIGYEHFETLVKGLCRADRVGDAVEIIEIMEKRGIVDGEIYGVIVNAYLRRKEVPKALEIFETMKKSGYRPTASTYTELMQNLFELDRYEEGCQLYEEMSENGVECDIVATTAVVAGHVRARRVDEARRVFANIALPTWKAYSVLVRELCRISSSEEILEVLDEMRGSEIPIGDEMFRWVTSHMERTGEAENLERVKRIQISEGEEKDVDLLDKSETDLPPPKTYDEDDLNALLEILLLSPRKWSVILEGLEKCGIRFTPELVSEALRRCNANGSAGLRFFSWVKKRSDFEHTPESYNAAMKLAGQGKDFRHMRELLREMRRNRVTVSPDTWTIVIMQYGRTGLTEIALKAFKEMKAERCEPTASTYKYLIMTLCGRKGKKPEEAIRLFKEMTKSGFIPDKELVEIYLGCLCDTDNLSAAKKCVNFLRNKAGFSVALSYSLFVRALCRAGKVDEALGLIYRAGTERENLELFTYGSVVHGLLRMNRVDEALEKMETMKSAGISPTVHVYTSLIVHYLREKQLEKALETLEKMREEGIEPTTVTHSAFIRGYVGLGRAEEAWNVFDRMKKDGPFPDFRTYSMFIDVLCQVGKSEEAMKLLEDMLRCSIVPSTINFRTVYHGLNREGKHSLAQAIMHHKFNLARKRKFLL